MSLAVTSSYDVGISRSLTFTLSDDEVPPSPLRLSLALTSPNYLLTVSGAASRLVTLERSVNLTNWQFFTTMFNASGTNTIVEAVGTNLFFRASQSP